MASHSHVDVTQVKEYVRCGKYPACMSGSSAKGLWGVIITWEIMTGRVIISQ